MKKGHDIVVSRLLQSVGNCAGPNTYSNVWGPGHGDDFGYGFYKPTSATGYSMPCNFLDTFEDI